MTIKGLKTFNHKDRDKDTLSLSQQSFDLIVIGGGITGAGIILDAALRGLKVLLVEKSDFASGTSSRSTKLIHGGLRYLKQFEFGLVRETGLERAVAHQNACHLVHPENMLLPIVKNGSFTKLTAGMAISVYERLASVKRNQRKKYISKQNLRTLEPLMKKERLRSGILYTEYRTDDARLTIELIKAARRSKAEAMNYMEVTHFLYADNKVSGINCHDYITGKQLSFHGTHIVSAVGPWADVVCKKDKQDSISNLHLSKGSHIVLDRKDLNIGQSIYFDAFDGRMIFAIPRGQSVYIGTTDTTYTGHLDEVRCNNADAHYLISALQTFFDLPTLSIDKIRSSWAGIRPLIKQAGKGPTEISRKEEIFISDSGLISIAGGKLTGFRKMAKKIVDLVVSKSGKDFKDCETKDYKIHHQPFDNYSEYLKLITDLENTYTQYGADTIHHLVSSYGHDANWILNHANENGVDIEMSQLEYTMNYEAVCHPLDHLERRTGYLYFDITKAKSYRTKFIEKLADHLDRDPEWVEKMNKETARSIEKHQLVS